MLMTDQGKSGDRIRRSFIGGFARDDRGATIIEFAIVAAPFIALLLAVVQTSLVMFTQQVLETSTEKSARFVLTGGAQLAGLTKSTFKQKVCSSLPGNVKCADLLVDVRVASNFDESKVGRDGIEFDSLGNINDTTTYQPGNSGDIVVLRLIYPAPVVAGPLGFDLSNMRGGRHLLVATAIFKNETY